MYGTLSSHSSLTSGNEIVNSATAHFPSPFFPKSCEKQIKKKKIEHEKTATVYAVITWAQCNLNFESFQIWGVCYLNSD